MSNDPLLLMGKIVAVYGIQGWVKVQSFTQPMGNLLRYQPWQLQRNGQPLPSVKVRQSRPHGNVLVAQLEGVDDRNQASSWVGVEIYLARSQLPRPTSGQHYWFDLVGCGVFSPDDQPLGSVLEVLNNGAHDILRLDSSNPDGEVRMIPYIKDRFVLSIDIDQRRIVADWYPDY
jgi:16S rRNA processing protein RimM